ncbi:MAG: hypothetical protein HY709_06560 [Candidatus Latescibacteria bacterium]|nr:hypothetical protein [Candidatus Latescibacterota bacterium]
MLIIKTIALLVLSTLTFLGMFYLFILVPEGVRSVEDLRGVRSAEDLRRILYKDTTATAIRDTVRFGPPESPIEEQVGYIEEAIKVDSTAVVQTQADTAALQREIEQLVREKKALEETKIAELAKLYEAMKPDAAAAILTNLDDKKVIKILNRMKDRQAAKILTSTAMPPERAAQITKLMREGER